MSNNPHDLISIGEVTIPFYEDNLIVQLGFPGGLLKTLSKISVDAVLKHTWMSLNIRGSVFQKA